MTEIGNEIKGNDLQFARTGMIRNTCKVMTLDVSENLYFADIEGDETRY
jgi:hypothetical protein